MNTFVVFIALVLISQTSAFQTAFYRHRASLLMSSNDFSPSSPQQSTRLDRELDAFFETAAKSGSKNTKKLTPQERADLTAKGVALEDLIFEARDRLLDLEDTYMREPSPSLLEEINLLRDEINGLRDDYILLVGAKDLPLYFGKPHQ